MKKSLLWLVIIAMCLAILGTFSLMGCKEEAMEEEAMEEEAMEEEAMEEEAMEEEAMEEEAEETTEEGLIFEEPTEPVEITYSSWMSDKTDHWNKLNDAFTAIHPNITIKVEPMEQFDLTNPANFELGKGTDTTLLFAFDPAREFYDNGWVMPFTDDMIYKISERFPSGQLQAYTKVEEDVLFAMPLGAVAYGVFYNKDLFDQYGLTEPKTWAEFLSICQTFKDNGITAIGLNGKDAWTRGDIPLRSVGGHNWGGEFRGRKNHIR